jgi:hypothetical protein
MKMKLSDWASLAEIIAAIGVILSLIFVGLQINEGNQETRAATLQAAADGEAFMIATMLNHSDTWHKVVTGAPLENEEEIRIGILLFNLVMTESENRFHQYNSGFLDSQSWHGRLASLRPLVKLPIFRVWKESIGSMNHSADFLALMDRLAEDANTE